MGGRALGWTFPRGFLLFDCLSDGELSSLLARLKPREVLTEKSPKDSKRLTDCWKDQVPLSASSKTHKTWTSVTLIFYLQIPISKKETQAAAKLLNYVKSALRGIFGSVALKPLCHFAPSRHFLSIDADSFRSLDILSTNASDATLFNTLNECQTAFGVEAPCTKAPGAFPQSSRYSSCSRSRPSVLLKWAWNLWIRCSPSWLKSGTLNGSFSDSCLRRPQGLHVIWNPWHDPSFPLLKPSSYNQGVCCRVNWRIIWASSPQPWTINFPSRCRRRPLPSSFFSSSLDELRQLPRDNSAAVFAQLAGSTVKSAESPISGLSPLKAISK